MNNWWEIEDNFDVKDMGWGGELGGRLNENDEEALKIWRSIEFPDRPHP
jgi:hypothetical protein